MKTKLLAATMFTACAIAVVPGSASAGWNSFDWALFARAITPPPAPVVIQQSPPTVVVLPGQAAVPPALCEVKPYIQYKDEYKVLGDQTLGTQACAIRSQMRRTGDAMALQVCDQELAKIALVLQASDAPKPAPTHDDCFALAWGVSVGMSSDEVTRALASRGAVQREIKHLEILGKVAEQWRYDTFSIYFRNDIVFAVQAYP